MQFKDVILWNHAKALRDEGDHEALWGLVHGEIIRLNPRVDLTSGCLGATFDTERKIVDVTVDALGTCESPILLPETFTLLPVEHNLNLRCNYMEKLPDTMGCMRVGGELCLFYNKLAALPASMYLAEVGRCLRLEHNELKRFPASMGYFKRPAHGIRVHHNPHLTWMPEECFWALSSDCGVVSLTCTSFTTLPEWWLNPRSMIDQLRISRTHGLTGCPVFNQLSTMGKVVRLT